MVPYNIMLDSNTKIVIAVVRTPLSMLIITRPVKIQTMANALDTLALGTLSPYLQNDKPKKMMELGDTNSLIMELTN